jgi:hypothetical protein
MIHPCFPNLINVYKFVVKSIMMHLKCLWNFNQTIDTALGSFPTSEGGGGSSIRSCGSSPRSARSSSCGSSARHCLMLLVCQTNHFQHQNLSIHISSTFSITNYDWYALAATPFDYWLLTLATSLQRAAPSASRPWPQLYWYWTLCSRDM